ncbi:hypothetical protein SEA_WOFFORD_188 [Streptomyces phage Wofford]|uniref:Uncharacterized protein n=1 Tax=Streptomyces phage Wofford TaxID=2283267 RepID=A0A345MA10_9CAUD|nr:hypothetical protein HWB78_gp124 [Streptomyces phage Wollford]AXH67331.1 hypothetical protein SEA_WOFFORD_188 [Streptomyces phage Wollford]
MKSNGGKVKEESPPRHLASFMVKNTNNTTSIMVINAVDAESGRMKIEDLL